MRKILLCMLMAGVSACGYSSRDNELIGQAKKAMHNTPIVCPDFDDVDISLGVMRNGVGSMSTQDVWLNVPDKRDLDILKGAVSHGDIVKITYDIYRVAFCVEHLQVRKVEVVK